jgi:Na+-driven multidrug efflux pump
VAFIPMLATLVTTAVHWVWLWLFMNVFEMGVIGIPLASFITYGLQVVIILIYANTLD